ncbi:MAG TPA: DUF2460 domain-containing protein [bacterium]|nr:DUF2460 domain-containing protein [bacterium]HPI76043.1 DUF2460 domain-containing protein [bacterium]
MAENFPAGVIARYPYTPQPKFKTAVNEFGDGAEERVALWTASRKEFPVTFLLTDSQYETLLDFFEARSGRLEAFNWTCPADEETYLVRFAEDTLNAERYGHNRIRVSTKFVEVDA